MERRLRRRFVPVSGGGFVPGSGEGDAGLVIIFFPPVMVGQVKRGANVADGETRGLRRAKVSDKARLQCSKTEVRSAYQRTMGMALKGAPIYSHRRQGAKKPERSGPSPGEYTQR